MTPGSQAKAITDFLRRGLRYEDHRRDLLPRLAVSGAMMIIIGLIALPFARAAAIVALTYSSGIVVITVTAETIKQARRRRRDQASSGT